MIEVENPSWNPTTSDPHSGLWAGELVLQNQNGLVLDDPAEHLAQVVTGPRVPDIKEFEVGIESDPSLLRVSLVGRFYGMDAVEQRRIALDATATIVLNGLTLGLEINPRSLRYQRGFVAPYKTLGFVQSGNLGKAIAASPRGSINHQEGQAAFKRAQLDYAEVYTGIAKLEAMLGHSA